MSNPLYRWKKKQGKLNKSAKSNVVEGKVKMTKRSRAARLRARYRRGRWRSPKKAPLPLLPLIGGVIAPMLDAAKECNFVAQIQSDPLNAVTDMVDQISQHYIGFSTKGSFVGFNSKYMIQTYGGLVAGIVGHYVANKFGINRAMKRIPLVGKYIAL